MRTFLIGYDLNKPGQDYEPLYEKLKSYRTWWHHLDSTWLVRADLTAVDLRNELKPLLDASDELLVVDVTGDAAAWSGFKKRGSDWLLSHL
jgi:hypothetical protein